VNGVVAKSTLTIKKQQLTLHSIANKKNPERINKVNSKIFLGGAVGDEGATRRGDGAMVMVMCGLLLT
jgi:hypothetical protein